MITGCTKSPAISRPISASGKKQTPYLSDLWLNEFTLLQSSLSRVGEMAAKSLLPLSIAALHAILGSLFRNSVRGRASLTTSTMTTGVIFQVYIASTDFRSPPN